MSQNTIAKEYILSLIERYGETVTFFSIAYCPYCFAAKNILTKLQISYKELKIDDDNFPCDKLEVADNLTDGFSVRTFPQIFIGRHHVGGYNELSAIFKDQSLYTVLDENLVDYMRAPE
jgi:glutaredoxin 3